MDKRAVLFDWRGTLVVPPTFEDWIRDGLGRCGRGVDGGTVDRLVAQVIRSNGPIDRFDTPGMDADASLHRRISLEVLADAGLDPELADAVYASESDWRQNPFACDAAHTVRALADAGILIGIVSDIHFDIRPAFSELGVADAVATYSLSFEIGAQKPDPVMFDHALEALGAAPSETLFVGDRPGPDGGAVEHGMMTLLLPPLTSPRQERLGAVTRLLLNGDR
jgi:HAD superfamily hydrolase (TIGR01509 family)